MSEEMPFYFHTLKNKNLEYVKTYLSNIYKFDR